MTIPAVAGSANTATQAESLPFPNPPALDAAALIRAALTVEVTPAAFRVYSAIVLMDTTPGWFDLRTVAHAAGVTEGQARQFLGELVRAGLLIRRKRVVYSPTRVPSARNRYAVAVTA